MNALDAALYCSIARTSSTGICECIPGTSSTSVFCSENGSVTKVEATAPATVAIILLRLKSFSTFFS